MITSEAWRGKRYAVLGLARSGVATVEALLASGARVVAWDGDEARRTALGAPSDGEDALSFADPLAIDLTGFDGVVVSPGVPLNRHPIAAHATAAGVPIIGDIELFAQARASLPPHRVVGITGTNGKSTTTALIHHILETAGAPSLMGGNIGLPILSQTPLPAGGVYVLELSSYQIDLTFSLDCDIAVLTNITPDHLDRYEGFDGYVASKKRLFQMQRDPHTAVLTYDDEAMEQRVMAAIPVTNIYQTAAEQVLQRTIPGWLQDCQEAWPALQGPHNAQNAACAIAACRTLGLVDPEIEKGLTSYPGLPHRMERVAEREGVLFVNDSKATNATATAPALAAYPLIHWILGGLPKTDDLDDCTPHFDHVVAGYTIGEAGPLFTHILTQAGKRVTQSGTLAQAVRDAAAAAQPGEVVMLSPACASFDQFKDYEARGQAFRDAVAGL